VRSLPPLVGVASAHCPSRWSRSLTPCEWWCPDPLHTSGTAAATGTRISKPPRRPPKTRCSGPQQWRAPRRRGNPRCAADLAVFHSVSAGFPEAAHACLRLPAAPRHLADQHRGAHGSQVDRAGGAYPQLWTDVSLPGSHAGRHQSRPMRLMSRRELFPRGGARRAGVAILLTITSGSSTSQRRL
jgi:hypothetical protein